SGEGAGTQHQGEVMRGFLTEVPVYPPRFINAALDHRRRIHFLLEHDGHLTPAILFGEGAKAPSRFTGEDEINLPLSGHFGVAALRGAAQVATRHDRSAAEHVPIFAGVLRILRARFASATHDFRAWGEN